MHQSVSSSYHHVSLVCCGGVLQQRRLAFAGHCHLRLAPKSLLMDFDVLVKIGTMVIAQSLVTRDEVAVALATEQRQRALRGETILRGTIVWFVDGGEGVYVGGADDAGAASQSSQRRIDTQLDTDSDDVLLNVNASWVRAT